MDISPSEAKEALAAIQLITQKTRRTISSSGAYLFLIVWGVIWLLGFLGSQFLPQITAGYAWMVMDILGGVISAIIGIRIGRAVRFTHPITNGKHIAYFWLLLFVYCWLSILITSPADGKQIAMLIIIFVMIGWMAMGLLLSVSSAIPGLIISALAIIGYFLLPDIFYIWMAILGGGGMIGLGLYIRAKW